MSVRLRQVVPVAARHLALHRRELQPGRVEDAFVVGQPEPLAGIGGRRVLAACAGAELESVAVPADAAFRGQDRPAHLREAAREERRHCLDDVMLGLEPRDVADRRLLQAFGPVADVIDRGIVPRIRRRGERFVQRGDRTEAHERLHLVHVAAHRLGHPVGVDAIGIERIVAQRGFAAQAPEQAVEQHETTGIAVQDHALAERQECGRHRHRAVLHRCGRRTGACSDAGVVRRVGEQLAVRRIAGLPDDPVGRDAFADESPAGGAKRVEIDAAGQHDRADVGAGHRRGGYSVAPATLSAPSKSDACLGGVNRSGTIRRGPRTDPGVHDSRTGLLPRVGGVEARIGPWVQGHELEAATPQPVGTLVAMSSGPADHAPRALRQRSVTWLRNAFTRGSCPARRGSRSISAPPCAATALARDRDGQRRSRLGLESLQRGSYPVDARAIRCSMNLPRRVVDADLREPHSQSNVCGLPSHS